MTVGTGQWGIPVLLQAGILLPESSFYSSLLFHILEKYQENLLGDVLAQLRRDGVITKVKVGSMD